MMTTTQTLADFLESRLQEDEAVALAASNSPWHALTFYPTRSVVTNETNIDGGVIVSTPSKDDEDATHIARHNPARVLAEVAAKRVILSMHHPSGEYETDDACVLCQWDVDCEAPRQSYHDGAGVWPCPTLRALASVYASHPDFREEWAS